MLKKSLIVALAVLGVLVGALTSGVASAGPVTCGERPIRLAFYDFGLFHFADSPAAANAAAKGIDKDIVDELIKRSGCKFETHLLVRARIWADLAAGALDMTVSGIQNPERDRFAWFADYLVMKNFAIVHADAGKTVKTANDFIAAPALKFGAVRAFKHGAEQDQWLATLLTQQRVEESPDVETIFRKLKDKRVHAVFAQPPVYRRLLAMLDMQNVVQVEDWTPTEKGVPHGLVLTKSRFSEADAEQWRGLLKEMRRDGTLKAIYSRYLPAAEAAKLLEY